MDVIYIFVLRGSKAD